MDEDKYRALIDGHVRDGEARGEFDDLPGSGRPLADDSQPYDENWWVKGLIARENLDMTAALPPSLAVRKELQRLPQTLAAMAFESQVREHLTELNGRIREARLNTIGGPPVVLRDVDVDDLVRQWHRERIAMKQAAAAELSRAGSGSGSDTGQRESRMTSGRRWWRR